MSQVDVYVGPNSPVRLSISQFPVYTPQHRNPSPTTSEKRSYLSILMKNLEKDSGTPVGGKEGGKGDSKDAGKKEAHNESQLQHILASKYATELFKGQNVMRTDTPDTLMTEYTNKPDITVRCDKCGIFIDIRTLVDHRSFHNALALMKFKCSTLPDNAEALLKRRNAILRRMKSDATETNPIDPKAIKLINDAYERLKSDIEDTYDMCRQIRQNINTNVNGVSLNCSPSCTLAVGLCSSQNERWKSVMEDTRVFQDYFGDDRDKCYLALFDGHHGRFAAEVAASELHRLLLNEMAKFDPKTKSTSANNLADVTDISHYKFDRPDTKDSERVLLHQESMDIVQQIIALCEAKYDLLMKDKKKLPEVDDETKTKKSSKPKHPLSPKISSAFKKAYHLLDILLSYGKDECSKVRWSGCSALTAIVHATEPGNSSKGSESSPGKDGEEGGNVDPAIQLGLVHLANAGNIHGLLVRGNRPYRLTKDHTPSNPKERNRVLKNGGTLSESSRECQVNGVVATTRGLGNHGDLSLKKCLQVEPHTTCVPIDQYAQFLVFATNGVWEIFSDQEVTSLLLKRLRKLQKMLPTHHVPPPSSMSCSLRPLLDEIENNEKAKQAEAMRATFNKPDSRKVSFSNHDLEHGDLPDIEVEASMKELSNICQSEGDDMSENAQATSTPVEEIKTGQVTGLTIEADLKTEIGSHVEDASDLDQGHDLDPDYLTLPVHADIPDHVPETEEEKQRELAKNMAEYLVQAALLAGAKDNISVMVMLLPGSGV
ncbi:LOW QUALITY PROTEIN: protein phosphatase 2C-like domain-containing protein 1 [Haliotis cracherodii]|uniref:LOW QUALITY PROTEIN: protein phosphatase 2C-like domain-containing protein 1 n=1 Tax=Haliotis cracherodii TaxID=6455 RepID=UPI0039E72F79